jgi:hypothetical protein
MYRVTAKNSMVPFIRVHIIHFGQPLRVVAFSSKVETLDHKIEDQHTCAGNPFWRETDPTFISSWRRCVPMFVKFI